MKHTLIALFVALFVAAAVTPAHAVEIGTDRKLGVGVGAGNFSNSFTAKWWLGRRAAVQAFAGLSAWGISINADYVVNMGTFLNRPFGKLFWGIGGGVGAVKYALSGNAASLITMCGVGQVGFHFKRFPLELIADFRPTYIVGDFIGGFRPGYGGAAARWYF